MYASGRGVKGDPVQAIRWHLIAQAGGNNDVAIDAYTQKQPPETIAAGQEAAKSWIAMLRAQREASARGMEPVPTPANRPAPMTPPR
jgi:TPR repeat protein